MAAQSIVIKLKANVPFATLTDNRIMRNDANNTGNGPQYVISYEDYIRLGSLSKANLIDVVDPEPAPYVVPLWDGTNYALDLSVASGSTASMNNATAWDATTTFTTDKELVVDNGILYRHLSGADSTGQVPALHPSIWKPLVKLGETLYGFGEDVFKFVKLVGNTDADVTVKPAVSSASWIGDKRDHEVTLDGDGDEFAGIFIANVTKNKYGWIQIAGTAVGVFVPDGAGPGDTAVLG